ncbi:hypothetical protein HYPSUDRAFT_170151 [Hypholoma sublateritium FD-334 SS-4]|uniref:F-box domain-containing protein n=1 Tax=Hypholoma sublateritium (strain FD-334 SS-4) TaxID=945553 RepID=A0A0D2NM37_HYPSF|nr:hypothetical protein HYPSUDRAFT_170151 [Hypholoma sublateritium FD-334 SS-4]
MIDLSASSPGVLKKLEPSSINEYVTTQKCPTCGTQDFSCKDARAISETSLSQLRFGYTVPVEERSSVSANIRGFCSDVKTLNHELAKLHSRIRCIEAQRADLELAISYQRALLSPIRTLPQEILVEILTFCSHGRVDVCSPRSEIWQFDKVCKRWRDVIRSTPTIWSSIDIYLGSLTPYRGAVPLSTVRHLIGRCMEYSRDTSLSIRFVEIGSPGHFHHVFGLLSQSSHRWKDMSFALSMLSEAPSLEHGLPRLRTLGLSGAYNGEKPFDSFQHAQQLTELRLFSILKPFHTLIIPWYQLRYFQAVFCDFRTGEFMELLAHLPSLVSLCSKWSKGLLKNHRKPIPPIKFRHLTTIEIEASPAEICTVLQPLFVPELTDLYLVSHQFAKATGNFERYMIADSVISLIQRSHAYRITKLSLSAMDAPTVSRILAETPAVTNLILIHISDLESILRELSTSESLAPRMKTFSLTCKGNQAMFSVGPLSGIIRFRGAQRAVLNPQSAYSADPGRLSALNVTVRESGGFQNFAELLQSLSRDNGVSIAIHFL